MQIEHFASEQSWYQDMLKSKTLYLWTDPVVADITLVDDHSLVAQKILAVLDDANSNAEPIRPASDIDAHHVLSLSSFYCSHCIKLGRYLTVSREEAEAHVRKKYAFINIIVRPTHDKIKLRHNDLRLEGVVAA